MMLGGPPPTSFELDQCGRPIAGRYLADDQGASHEFWRNPVAGPRRAGFDG
jgi:hypothetical protein